MITLVIATSGHVIIYEQLELMLIVCIAITSNTKNKYFSKDYI